MAFEHVNREKRERTERRERNWRPENRCCTNCSYYKSCDGEWICTLSQYTRGVIYRMPPPSIACNKVCGGYVPR